ncbi:MULTISPECIES: aminotransferase class V-fold PLP-dependent enzyme [unclassified Lacticaseibacillus]|uniref:aminotransferase class V-fold PLP-dependent enzyme n=1 Tax=unclassified Lacticaseibacillus TaxID=2759744 RepID=UPI001940A920|nr:MULTISPECIES: cysteine desulfurase [unclassified Lacticaseibacillus]
MSDEFPFFKQHPELTYLDSAATSQKPQSVIDALAAYYTDDNANVHRGLYKLAYNTTESYEAVRAQAARFINAPAADQIVFTRSTTDGLNLVASSFGPLAVHEGDEILVSGAEHHSNFIPWQQLAKRTGAKFVVAPVTKAGNTDSAAIEQLLTPRTKILALAQVTNVAGGAVAIRPLADLVHARGGYMVVDGAQAVAHMKVDVQALGADFYAFSGHKMYGPTGIGVLYGRADLLAAMPPVQFGGEMIDEVQDAVSTWAAVPLKFEAGTPNIAGVFGLKAALDYISHLNMANVSAHDHALVQQLRAGLAKVPGITLYGDDQSIGIVSFNLAAVHPHDLATVLDEANIAVRAGHHCAQPLMARLGVPATVRASFGVYNTPQDVEALIAAVDEGRRFFHESD